MSGIIETLRKARAFIEDRSMIEGYGFFPGGDPRNFTPDSENTAEELAAHKAACEAWERGEQVEFARSGRVEDVHIPECTDATGNVRPAISGPAIVCGSRLGMGLYTIRDEEADALLDEIEAAIATMEASTSEACVCSFCGKCGDDFVPLSGDWWACPDCATPENIFGAGVQCQCGWSNALECGRARNLTTPCRCACHPGARR